MCLPDGAGVGHFAMELSAAGGTLTAGDRAGAVPVGIVRHCAGYFAAVRI